MSVGYQFALTPDAQDQLNEIEEFIAREASSAIATRYVEAILGRCESLVDFPRRGTPRDDLRPGIRTIPFRRRVTIAYVVEEARVVIVGIFYAGRDMARLGPD